MDLILSHPTSQGSALAAKCKPSGQYVCFMAKMGLSLSQILKRFESVQIHSRIKALSWFLLSSPYLWHGVLSTVALRAELR
jgi:hypothetical protein